MARRSTNRLSVRTVESIKRPGMYCDGGGLYVKVSKTLTKSWIFRYRRNGRLRDLGLGPFPLVSLAEAREKAHQARRMLFDGTDPIEHRRAERRARRQAAAPTFDECAKAYIETNRAGWRNAKHAEQWANTLAAYASPVIGGLPVAEISTGHVLRVLDPIWTAKPETAARLRGRIEAVLDWARVRGFRSGENPARWRGHLDKLLPKRSKVASTRHFPALHYARIGAFMAALRQQEGMAARALEFAILTAARSGEVRGARWQEFDIEARRWVIPADRMKAGREHHVPLSEQAVELLARLPRFEGCDLVFPGTKGGPLSDMSLTAVIRRMNEGRQWLDASGEEITVHGFRSAFRDWAGEATAYPREVIEHALAHRIPDKAEAAYARGTLFEKRRQLMQAWADYCDWPQEAAEVVPIRGGRQGCDGLHLTKFRWNV